MVGILSAEALFLALAGLTKLLHPVGSSTALRAARLPAALTSSGAVRVFALVEVAAGGAVLVFGGRVPAALFAATFSALAAVSARMTATSPGRDCGCFGTTTAPVSHWHTAVDVACALTGVVGVVVAPPGLAVEVARQPWFGIPFASAVLLLAWLCFLTVTALPALLHARAALEDAG